VYEHVYGKFKGKDSSKRHLYAVHSCVGTSHCPRGPRIPARPFCQ
jgi:hypothetical protein